MSSPPWPALDGVGEEAAHRGVHRHLRALVGGRLLRQPLVLLGQRHGEARRPVLGQDLLALHEEERRVEARGLQRLHHLGQVEAARGAERQPLGVGRHHRAAHRVHHQLHEGGLRRALQLDDPRRDGAQRGAGLLAGLGGTAGDDGELRLLGRRPSSRAAAPRRRRRPGRRPAPRPTCALRTPAVETSTSTAPLPRPASAPSGPSRAASTAFSSERHRKTRSWPAAASRGVAALFAPFFTSGSALDAVRFQTVTVWPDLRRLLAMGAPMVPVPRNPIFMIRPL